MYWQTYNPSFMCSGNILCKDDIKTSEVFIYFWNNLYRNHLTHCHMQQHELGQSVEHVLLHHSPYMWEPG